MKIRELFKSKHRWLQGDMSLTGMGGFGTSVKPTANNALSWCLLGAVKKCYPPPQRGEVIEKIAQKVLEHYGLKYEWWEIRKLLSLGFEREDIDIDRTLVDDFVLTAYNDDPNRSFDEVKNLVTKLDV